MDTSATDALRPASATGHIAPAPDHTAQVVNAMALSDPLDAVLPDHQDTTPMAEPDEDLAVYDDALAAAAEADLAANDIATCGTDSQSSDQSESDNDCRSTGPQKRHIPATYQADQPVRMSRRRSRSPVPTRPLYRSGRRSRVSRSRERGCSPRDHRTRDGRPREHSRHHTRERAIRSPHTRERAIRSPHTRERPLPSLPVDNTQSYWMVPQANTLFAAGATPADTLTTLLHCAHETSAAAQEYRRTLSRVHYDTVIERVRDKRATALAAWTNWTTAVSLLSSVHPRPDLSHYIPDILVHIQFYSGQRFFTIQRREDYLPARDVVCIFDGPALVGAYNVTTGEFAATHKYVEASLDRHFSFSTQQQWTR